MPCPALFVRSFRLLFPFVLGLALLTAPGTSLAGVGTNPASGNPLDYGGTGDWYGSTDPDQLTNESGATVGGNIYGNDNSADGSSGGENTISNAGTVDDNIYGSYNDGAGSSGGSNTIINSGDVDGSIYGTDNWGTDSSGGGNTIINSGAVALDVCGSRNYRDGTSGGDNTIINEAAGTIGSSIVGTYNVGEGSSGGGNTIINHGTTAGLNGTYNLREDCSGGSNTITNYGSTDYLWGCYNNGKKSNGGSNTITNAGSAQYLWGSYNDGDGSGGGSNTIINTGDVGTRLVGSENSGDDSSGGDNSITNLGTTVNLVGAWNSGNGSSGGGNSIYTSGTTSSYIAGSLNQGENSSGGDNIITNSGSVSTAIIGSYNYGQGSNGGNNTISNSGIVNGNIDGSYNYGEDSQGGGNTIYNSGTVTGDINGSRNTGTGSSSGGAGNTIYNYGTVNGSIYAGDGDDTVVIGGGSSVDGTIDGQDGYDTLEFYNMGSFNPAVLGDYTYQNFESYGFAGGSNTLTGDWDTGGMDLMVNNGSLTLAGGVTLTIDDLYVYEGGILGGSGLITGHVINYGTISPGNSIGTLTINGDFINEGGTLLVELSLGGGDLLRVNGTATLNGGYLRTSLSPDIYLGGESWTVLRADSVVGSFRGLISSLNSATLSLALSYSGNSVGVSLSRKPYADFADTNGQSVVGAALDDIVPLAQSRGGYMADLVITMDFGYSAAQITQALQGLNAEMYPAYAFAQLESVGLAADAVDSRLDQARDRESVSTDTITTGTGISVWARAVGARTSLDASQGWTGHEQTWGGLVSGADYALGPHARLGLAVGYTVSDMSWDQSAYSGDLKALHLLAYVGGEWNNFHAQASAGLSWHEANAQRDMDLAGYPGKVQGEPSALSYLAGFKGGYDFHLGGWRLGPLVGFRYIHLERDGFRESSDLGLNIESSDADSLLGTLGVGGSTRWQVNSAVLRPRLGLAWQHEFDDDPFGVTAWFADYADVPMVFSGQERPSERLVLDAALGARLTGRLDGSLAVSQAWGDGYLASALSLSLQYNF